MSRAMNGWTSSHACPPWHVAVSAVSGCSLSRSANSLPAALVSMIEILAAPHSGLP